MEHEGVERGQKGTIDESGMKDMKVWSTIGEEGRTFVDPVPTHTIHTDAAELGWGGTIGDSLPAGDEGYAAYQGVWGSEERKDMISLRELKAVSLVLRRAAEERPARK